MTRVSQLIASFTALSDEELYDVAIAATSRLSVRLRDTGGGPGFYAANRAIRDLGTAGGMLAEAKCPPRAKRESEAFRALLPLVAPPHPSAAAESFAEGLVYVGGSLGHFQSALISIVDACLSGRSWWSPADPSTVSRAMREELTRRRFHVSGKVVSWGSLANSIKEKEQDGDAN